MGKFLKGNYYILVRILIMLVYSLYGFMENKNATGVSLKVLLLVSFFISSMAIKEIVEGKKRIIFLLGALVAFIFLIKCGGLSYILLGYYYIFELLVFFKAPYYIYFLSYLGLFVNSPVGNILEFMIITMLLIFYLQHEYVVAGYEKQMYEDTVLQQGMKKDMEIREFEVRSEQKKNMLMAENKVLEERASLSQTLHDKLGHNINGSIYQLEAVKVIMDKEPEKARGMIQSVIDQLRGGMDEIRAILRKERPEKKKMAMVQLYELCGDCNEKGVEAQLHTEGKLDNISDDLWEVILDNIFEAVTNSMKYSKCKKIDIDIVSMKEMVRCTVRDDGIGCDKIVDGMGISGMRQRVRARGGMIDFESQAGFKVNMILPIITKS